MDFCVVVLDLRDGGQTDTNEKTDMNVLFFAASHSSLLNEHFQSVNTLRDINIQLFMVGTLTTGILALKAHFMDNDDEDVPRVSLLEYTRDKRDIRKNVKAIQINMVRIPSDIWADEILQRLDRSSVRNFLAVVGQPHNFLPELETKFCMHHGTKLEIENFDLGNSKTTHCPMCYMAAKNLTRCQKCLEFYPLFTVENQLNYNHLWCQGCESMAFCNSCLSHEVSCQSPKGCQCTRCDPCCPNVLTNTICGEYICTDCATLKERYDCNVCGKATCLDESCLICNHARLCSETDVTTTGTIGVVFWISLLILVLAIVFSWIPHEK